MASTPRSVKQTGPKTPQGKAASSLNAVQHGLLSRRAILPGENPDDFQALFDGLVAEHRPVGLTETTLVEKIALCLWRQQRLVAAEMSRLALRQSRHDKQVQEMARRAMGLGYGQINQMMEIAQGIDDSAEAGDDETASTALQHAQRAMAIPDADDPLPRYQTAADNELFKTLRALREAQAWRLAHQTIDVDIPLGRRD